jgi:hypothetical protein
MSKLYTPDLTGRMANPTLSENFYKLLMKEYPGLMKRMTYRRLMGVLMFGTFADRDTGNMAIPASMLARIERQLTQYKWKKYCGEAFLEAFQDEVMSPRTFSWTMPSIKYHKVRTAIVRWKTDIQTSLDRERKLKVQDAGLVYLHDGSVVTEQKLRDEYRQRVCEGRRRILMLNPAAEKVLNYLDGRSVTLYRQIVNRNLEAAWEAVERIEDDPDGNKRAIALNTLLQIQKFPKPVYGPSIKDATDRIFTLGSSYLGLKGCVRKALLRGWYNFDLQSAQLAIAARLWDIPVVQEFLDSGEKIWVSLMNHLGIDPGIKSSDPEMYEQIKKPLKNALYQCIFGMPVNGVRYKWYDDHPAIYRRVPGISTKFFTHHVVRALLDARERTIQSIRQRGGAMTCFGKKLRVKQISASKDNVPSIMAQQAQAVELQLLLPVIDLVQESKKEVQILLWLHDGFVAQIKDKRRTAYWTKQLQDCVGVCALELGVMTALECECL